MARGDLENGAGVIVGLSSAAAPDASLDGLLAACARRALPALELRPGDAHGVHPSEGTAAGLVARRAADSAGVELTGYRVLGVDDEEALVAFGKALGAPLILSLPRDFSARLEAGARLDAAGIEVLIGIGAGDADHAAKAAVSRGLGLAWDADPSHDAVGTRGAALLELAGPALRSIRMLGGGPEAVMHEGRGVGELMARLALAGYRGAFILAPSGPRYRVAWDKWLGRRGGWGCGSKGSDPSLVQLETTVGGAAK